MVSPLVTVISTLKAVSEKKSMIPELFF